MKRLGLLVLLVPGLVMAEPVKAPEVKPTKQAHSVREHAKLEIAPPGHPIKQLTIDNPLGNVRIEGYDGTALQIESSKEAPDEDALQRLRISLVPNPDGAVRISTTADGGHEVAALKRAAVRIDLLIRAPRNTRIEATVSTGTLEVINMDAGGDLDTASGAISVRNVSGEVFTHSVSGPTRLKQVFGSVDAQSLSADVDMDIIQAERLIASSAGKGRIAGHEIKARDVELTTTEGRIVLDGEVALRGHLVVSSLNGDLDVRMHRRGAVTLRARAGGKLELGPAATVQPQAGGWSQAQFGTGDQPALIELRSRFGTVAFALIE